MKYELFAQSASASPHPRSSQTTREQQLQLRLHGEQLIKAIAAEASPAELGHLYYQLAKIHDDLGLFSEAAAHYQAAAYSLEAANQPLTAAQAYLQLGELQVQLDLDLAFAIVTSAANSSFTKALTLSRCQGGHLLESQALHNLGRLQELNGNLEEALSRYCAAESALSQSGQPNNVELDAHRAELLDSIASVKTELIIRQTLALARAVTPSGAPEALPPEAGAPEAISPRGASGSGPRPWWRWPRR